MSKAIVRRQSKMHIQKCTLPPQVKHKFMSTVFYHITTQRLEYVRL